MGIFWAILLGAFLGWLASVITRADTTESIILQIAAGLLGAMPMAALLGNNSTLDSLLAGAIGAVFAIILLHAVRRRLARH